MAKETVLKRHNVLNKLQEFHTPIIPFSGSKVSLVEVSGNKFSYFIHKNVSKLKKEYEKIENRRKELIIERGELSDEFIQEEKAILEKHASKHPNGKPMVNNDGLYNIPDESLPAFEKDKKKLHNKFKEEGKRVVKFTKDLEEYMNGEITIEFHHIKKEDIPESINAVGLSIIDELIVE